MSDTIPVALAPHWRVYLEGLVQNRRFASVDDAIEDALRLMEKSENRQDRLERLLQEGEDSGDAGPWDLPSFLAEMRDSHAGREAA